MLTVRGVTARIARGYHAAAVLGAYTVTTAKDDDSGVVTVTATAVVLGSNTYWLSQRPLVFEAPYAKGAFRWPVTELQITDGALTARLGPKER